MTPLARSVLHDLRDAETRGDFGGAEIVGEGSFYYVGLRRISGKTVNQLLRLFAISDSSDANDVRRYRFNDVGRALLANPAIENDIQHAIVKGGAWTVRDGNIVELDAP